MTLEATSETATECGIGPIDSVVAITHAEARYEFSQGPEEVFEAFTGLRGYERWDPEVQGPAHWLAIREGGVGSRFVVYNKPGSWHLLCEGTVTVFERGRRFAWEAPFQEWPRASFIAELELTSTPGGGTLARESWGLEVPEEYEPVLEGFLSTSGLDADTFDRFLQRRLAGLARALDDGTLEAYPAVSFERDVQVAVDWAGRIAEGSWTRILYADGEVDFDAAPEVVFNAFSRFSRYPDWTRDIHVGCEWLKIHAGGVGSKFLLWEKPGGRQVMHRAVVTEFEPARRFVWRAPFAEWGKVFIGTALSLEPRSDGTTHGYHLLYADVPTELLSVFGGFGVLHGFDLEFETFHIHEEARGFNRLLQQGAFSTEETSDLFDRDRRIAIGWPLQEGRRWPEETLTLRPDRTVTYEELMIELSQTLADSTPSPAFLRRYRDLARTETYRREMGW